MIVLDYPVAQAPPWARMRHNSSVVDPRIVTTRNVAYGVVAPVAVAVGMLGNLLTIALLNQPQFKGVTYTYFLALAVSDLLSLFFSISLIVHLVRVATYAYSTAVWYSHLEMLFVNGPMSCSVLIVVCVTVDRFFSVCRPRDFKSIHTPRQARKGIIAAVCVSLLLWLPTCFIKEPRLYNQCNSTTSFVPPPNSTKTWWVSCMLADTLDTPWYLAYSWIRQVVVTFIPIGVLVTMNTMIVREYLHVRNRRRGLAGRQEGDERRKEDRNLINLLLAVMVSFFVTMVPAGIFNATYTEFLSSEFEYEIFRAVANNLEILNHALNFYLYILCSKPLRVATRKYLQRCRLYITSSRPYTTVMDFRNGFKVRWKDQIQMKNGVIFRGHRESQLDENNMKKLSRETEPSMCLSSVGEEGKIPKVDSSQQNEEKFQGLNSEVNMGFINDTNNMAENDVNVEMNNMSTRAANEGSCSEGSGDTNSVAMAGVPGSAKMQVVAKVDVHMADKDKSNAVVAHKNHDEVSNDSHGVNVDEQCGHTNHTFAMEDDHVTIAGTQESKNDKKEQRNNTTTKELPIIWV